MGDKGEIAAKISQIAARQYGHVTRVQLLELGLRQRTIGSRIGAGKLIAVHAGVYAVGFPRDEPLARAAAAVLACGPGATLSHSSAAALWGMFKRWERPFEVTVTTDRRPPGVRVHRSTTLARRDIRRHLGIRVTSPARTALEIAPRVSDKSLARAVNDSRRSGLLHLDELQELLERMTHHPGTSALKPFVANRQAPTRSDWEDEFPAFAARFGLPAPRLNAHVAGYEVDVLFCAERVIVELDGWDFHKHQSAFEDDRERDAATLAAGFATVRVTWDRFHNAAAREAARLNEILQARRPA